jgi:hypothetical protein
VTLWIVQRANPASGASLSIYGFLAEPMNSAHPVCADEKSSLIIAARWQHKLSISRDNFR